MALQFWGGPVKRGEGVNCTGTQGLVRRAGGSQPRLFRPLWRSWGILADRGATTLPLPYPRRADRGLLYSYLSSLGESRRRNQRCDLCACLRKCDLIAEACYCLPCTCACTCTCTCSSVPRSASLRTDLNYFLSRTRDTDTYRRGFPRNRRIGALVCHNRGAVWSTREPTSNFV